ncbi:MAG: tetraacyldisaccharide 4'-kinase [Deltaproteobacteria bacterium]|nr:tetraacyldisaccharide 4'-kinase [Deltaproteobacteria bacterium]
MRSIWHHLFDCLQGRGEAAAAPRCSLSAVAGGLAVVYGLGARLRRSLYANEVILPKRLPAPVVSVGNLAVGGTGKTPVSATLTRLFQDHGRRVAILSRGYGGQNSEVTCISDGENIFAQPPQVGEEAYWLARNLPGAAVYTGASRYAAGQAAWEQFRPDLFLLDDGFQHFQLHRDLDIVLLDAAAPFGNGFLLPRGILREPKSALAAAQVLILTRFQEERDQQRLTALQTAYPAKTVLTAAIAPSAVRLYPEGRTESPKSLQRQPLLAFAGLARPEFFQRSLADLGVRLTGFRAFPDHHPFTPAEEAALVQEAQSTGAAALITTAKDWARLAEKWDAVLPLWVLEVEAQIDRPERILEFL